MSRENGSVDCFERLNLVSHLHYVMKYITVFDRSKLFFYKQVSTDYDVKTGKLYQSYVTSVKKDVKKIPYTHVH